MQPSLPFVSLNTPCRCDKGPNLSCLSGFCCRHQSNLSSAGRSVFHRLSCVRITSCTVILQNVISVLPLNPLTPNDVYMSRTALLTSKRCILYIYSTNVCTEYFKHVLYSPFFSLQNAVCFIMLTCLVPVLFTF